MSGASAAAPACLQATERELEPPPPPSTADLLSSRLTNKFRNVNTAEDDADAPMSFEFDPLAAPAPAPAPAPQKVRALLLLVVWQPHV